MNLFWWPDVGVRCGFVYEHQNGALAGCQNGGGEQAPALSGHDLRGCLGLLHKLCSTNSTVEQLHKKLEFVEYLFRCSHNSTFFPRAECVELKPFG